MRRGPDSVTPREAWVAGCSPIDTREIFDWAAENIELPFSYARPGAFNVQSSRYLIEPLRAMRDNGIRKVTVMKAVQTGGTLIADVAVPWFVANNPGPILWNMQTDPVAEDHAVSRVIPMLQGCKSLKALLPTDPRLMTKSGVMFPHMPLWINGSAPAKLQSKSVLLLINDEVWLWDSGRLQWAMGRVSAFERVGLSKVLTISQPGDKGDDFDEMWTDGTMEEWEVQCPLCNGYFVPQWNARRDDDTTWGVKWDTNDTTRPDGAWNMPAVLETIRYECPSCRGEFKDGLQLKTHWNSTGRFTKTNPNPSPAHRSFRWSSITVDAWTSLVTQFIKAKVAMDSGVDAPMKVFIQSRLARPYDPEARVAGERMKAESYDVQTDWPDAVARFMTVDVQAEHYWVEVREWAANGESRQLHWGKEFTEDGLVELQQRLGVPGNCVFVDTGFDSRRIYGMLVRQGWTGFKGEDRDFYTHTVKTPKGSGRVMRFYSEAKYGDPAMGTSGQGKRFARFYMFASPGVKQVVCKLRDGKGPKWRSMPDREYEKQMFAERRQKVTDKFGRDKWVWAVVRKDNHAFDCACMQVVCAFMHPKVHLGEMKHDSTS